ncbi:MAG: tetratricopeptide repeat protein [Gemmatimonadales bacterium]
MNWHRATVPAACLMAVSLAMGSSLRNGFVYDDLPAIVQNSHVTDPAQWHAIPMSPYWLGTLWRPFTVAMFAWQWRLGQGAPWIFHLVLLAGYLGCGLALLGLLRRLAVDELPAVAVTLLFLVHPVHVEVVANGVGQAELWTAFALLAATSIYLHARQSGVTVAAVVVLLAMVAIGIAAKEQGFVAPLLLAGAEWLLLARVRESAATRLRLLIPVTALTVMLLVVRAGVLASFAGETPARALSGIGLAGRAVTFLGVIPEYLRLLFWPVHLQAEYGPPGIAVGGPMMLRHWLGLALLVGFVALFFRLRRSTPVAAFGLWWAAMTLAPVTNLLTPTGIILAERVLFLPSIGVAIALGAALQKRRETREEKRATADLTSRRSLVLATALLAWGVMLAARSATRVQTWSTQRRFFTDLTHDAPLAYRAWKGAGEYWAGAGDHPRAIADLRRALYLWPHDYEVNERLGQFLRSEGQCAAAIPVLAAGVQLDQNVPSIRAKLIECLIAEHRWDEADRYANEALARGQTEFQSERVRVARSRATAGSGPSQP